MSLYHYIKQTPAHRHSHGVRDLDFSQYLEWRAWAAPRTQEQFVVDEDGNQMIDFVGRYERLEADFATVARIVGIDASLAHQNRSLRRDYRDYYDPHTRGLVEDTWGPDVRRLGYSFDDGVERY